MKKCCIYLYIINNNFENNWDINKIVHNTPIPRIRNRLQELSKRNVFVLANKAACNNVVIYRKYYKDVLRNEIKDSSAQKVIKWSNIALPHHILRLLLSIHVKVPIMYLLTILHEKTVNHSFIAASSKFSTTNFSVTLTSSFTTTKDFLKCHIRK